MKKLMFYSSVLVLALLSSCTGIKLATTQDDVYANPAEDRQEAQRLAAEKKKAEEAMQKRYNDSVAAVREKENNDPKYKYPDYNKDDYYDYEYASRLRRFNNSVNGLSYYDNYYTNSYWYSGNPYQYGVSIYNGYHFWPSYYSYNYYPSSYFYSSMGWAGGYPGCGYGYSGYYNPYSGYSYGNPYWMGYYNGYNHGYYNGWWGNPYGYNGYGGYGYPYYGNGNWGYFNVYDQNSGYTYAPRDSHSGGSSHRMTNPDMNNTDNSYYQNFVKNAVTKQETTAKFNDVPVADIRYNRSNIQTNTYSGNTNTNIKNEGYSSPNNGNGGNNGNVYSTPNKNTIYHNNSQPQNQSPNLNGVKQQQMQQQQPSHQFDMPSNNPTPSFNTPKSGGMPSGGGRPR